MTDYVWTPPAHLADLDPDDFRVIEAKFEAMFSARRGDAGPFRELGPNFVTDEVLGYVTAFDGTHVEISTGVMCGDRLYGVTFRPDPANRSRCVWSLEEAWSAIS